MLRSPEATERNIYSVLPETIEREAVTTSYAEVVSPEERQNHFRILQGIIDIGDLETACKMAGDILGIEDLRDSDIPTGVEYLGVGPVYYEQGENSHHKADARAHADAVVMRIGRMHILGDEIAVDGVDGQRHHFVARTKEDLNDLRARLGARGYRTEGVDRLAPIEEAYNEAFALSNPDAPMVEQAEQRFDGPFKGIIEKIRWNDPLSTQILPRGVVTQPSLWNANIATPAIPGPRATAYLNPVENREAIDRYCANQPVEINPETQPMSSHEVLLVARRNLKDRASLLAAWGECRLNENAQMRDELTTLIEAAMNNVEPVFTGRQLNVLMTALQATADSGKTYLERREAEDALIHFKQIVSHQNKGVQYAEDNWRGAYPPYAAPQRIAPASRPGTLKRIMNFFRPKRGRHAA